MGVHVQRTQHFALHSHLVSRLRQPPSSADQPQTWRWHTRFAGVLLACVLCTLLWQIVTGSPGAQISLLRAPVQDARGSRWLAPGRLAASGNRTASPLLASHGGGYLNSSITSSSTRSWSSGNLNRVFLHSWPTAISSWLSTWATSTLIWGVPVGGHPRKRYPHQHEFQGSTEATHGSPSSSFSSSTYASSVGVARRQLQSASLLPLLGLALGLFSQLISPFAQICDDIQAPAARYACASSFTQQQPQLEPPIRRPATNRSDLEPRSIALCAGQLGAPLTTEVIASVKNAALQQLQQDLPEVYRKQAKYRYTNSRSGIQHPAQMLGPAEVALMQWRVYNRHEPTWTAHGALLNGTVAGRKMYRNATGSWWPTSGTPLEWTPHAIPELVLKYGGVTPSDLNATLLPHYTGPRGAGGPWQHIILVEQDGAQVYRQALAYLATGNEQYARNAVDIVNAWATTNKVFGVVWENGPLEAGWFMGSVVKGLELLKYTWPEYSSYKPDMEVKFNSWVDNLILPSWQRYLTFNSKETNQFGNWHSTIAEALMQLGLFRDNVTMVQQAVDLWTETHDNMLKWGSSNWTQVVQAKPDIDLLVSVYNEPQVAATMKPANASASLNSTSGVTARGVNGSLAAGNNSAAAAGGRMPAIGVNSTTAAGNSGVANATVIGVAGRTNRSVAGNVIAARRPPPSPPARGPMPPPAGVVDGYSSGGGRRRVLLEAVDGQQTALLTTGGVWQDSASLLQASQSLQRPQPHLAHQPPWMAGDTANSSVPASSGSSSSSSNCSMCTAQGRSLQFFLPGLDFTPMLKHYGVTRPSLKDQGWGFTVSDQEAPTTVISFGPFGVTFGPGKGGGGGQVPGEGSGDTITIRAEDYPSLPRSMVDLLNAPRAVVPRVRGEGTETLRDLYHTQFGLGSLIQVAELAWQQNIDLYSRSNSLMKDSLELHAQLTLQFPDKLPPGWADVRTMVKPPPGPDGKPLVWKFDMSTQTWYAQDSKGRKLIPLLDGVKYLVGVGFLPFGWEIAYNHYVGRRGLEMPYTRQLLERWWPEWYDFHWGAGTLTHADSAGRLWTPGLSRHTCKAGSKGKWWVHPLGKAFGTWFPSWGR